MKLKKAISILLSMCFILSAVLMPFTFNAGAETEAQLYLDDKMEKYDIHGVAYITRNGEVVCQSARGMANTAEGKEMTIDTMFPVGSLSKQFCATAILLLKEQGKLRVDDTLSMYFPEFTVAKDVTVKDLLTMRSGIRNYQEGLMQGQFTISADATSEENIQSILNWLYKKPLKFKPGNRHDYSNANFFLLSLIVENASGQDYKDFIKENIFTPLDMTHSGFYEELLNHPDLAEHTLKLNPGEYIDPLYKGYAKGAGDLVSNAKDYDKWLTALKDCTLLSEESKAEMTTNYNSDGYGYGIGVMDDGRLTHNGAGDNYMCVGITYPEDGFNAFVITNNMAKDELHVLKLSEELVTKFNPQGKRGDVNDDDKINVKDATMIQKHSAKIIVLNEAETLCADVNNDSKVNIKDATAIQKYIAKIETNLPIGDYI